MSDDLRPATDALIRHAILLQQVADLRPFIIKPQELSPDLRQTIADKYRNDPRPSDVKVAEIKATLDALWADFDAAYPQPLDLKPNAKP